MAYSIPGVPVQVLAPLFPQVAVTVPGKAAVVRKQAGFTTNLLILILAKTWHEYLAVTLVTVSFLIK